MLVFYFFAVIVVGLGVLSLRSGLSFAKYVHSEIARPLPDYTPFVSIIAPVRGLEEGLAENLEALFKQDYRVYEILFVTDDASDPALKIIEERLNASEARIARTIIAGPAIDSGQKVHNLRVAIAEVDPRSEVFVFVDSDARPRPQWLKSLVAPLIDEATGAATGYRWFIPAGVGLASHLRSVWNASIASALGPAGEKNFCWGGSTAIRRTSFDRLRVLEAWQGTVSDDFALTRVMQKAGLAIHFVPACLVASFADCSAKELLEFTNRQLKITRVYAPHLWKPVLLGSFLFTSVFFGGLVLVIFRAATGRDFGLALVLLILITGLGSAKSYIRLKAVAAAIGDERVVFRSIWAHVLLWPFASALYLWNAIVAVCSRRIEWRGITYELKSATEAVIIRNQAR